MICQRCLRRVIRQTGFSISLPAQRAAFSQSSKASSTSISAQAATTTNPRPHDAGPAATSTPGVAQPFSTPLSYSPSDGDAAEQKLAPQLPASSVHAGTVLKGLNFMKNAQDPVAREDAQYPDWLWTVLDQKKSDDSSATAVDANLFAKSKKQRQRANKELRKQQQANPGSLAPKIPLHEQTIDLPVGNSNSMESVTQAQSARHQLTKSMRENRKRKIKEANFLKGMK